MDNMGLINLLKIIEDDDQDDLMFLRFLARRMQQQAVSSDTSASDSSDSTSSNSSENETADNNTILRSTCGDIVTSQPKHKHDLPPPVASVSIPVGIDFVLPPAAKKARLGGPPPRAGEWDDATLESHPADSRTSHSKPEG